MSDDSDLNVRYMQQVIAWQPRLYAFILSLTGDTTAADDVLQNTNLVLLKKKDAFRDGSDFGAWAMQIASIEVRQYRDADSRSGRWFDDVLIDQLASKAPKTDAELGADLRALRDCMARLSATEREMLVLRYGDSSVHEIAEKWGRSPASISQTLYRARSKLAQCIKRSLAAEQRDEP